MEVAVLSRGSAVGAHMALSLALAAQKGEVPTSLAGDGLILRVHLQLDRGCAAFSRSMTVEGSAVSPHGPGGFLETHEHSGEARWLNRCKLTLLMCSPALLEPTLAWFLAHAAPQAALFCLVPGFGHEAAVEAALQERVKDKTLLLLFGAPTYACGVHPLRGYVQTSAGALLMARLERKDDKTGLVVFLQALEASGLRIIYRATKYRNNWLFGACLWQSFHTYAALLPLEPPGCAATERTQVKLAPKVKVKAKATATATAKRRPAQSLYQLLNADVRHRLVFARLIMEARSVCPPGHAKFIDSAGSPLGLGFGSVLWLLRFPWPVFAPVLSLVLLLTSLEWPGSFAGAPFGDCLGPEEALGLAESVNGYVVAQGRRAGVATPVSALLLDKTRRQKRGFSPKEMETCLGGESPINAFAAASLVLLVLSFFLVGVPYFVLLCVKVALA